MTARHASLSTSRSTAQGRASGDTPTKPLTKLAACSIRPTRELLLRLASAVHHVGRDPGALAEFRKLDRLAAARDPTATRPSWADEISRYRDLSAFESLRDLISSAAVQAGLYFLKTRKATKGYRYDMAAAAYAVARWVGVSPEQDKALKAIMTELDPKRKGMTSRNRDKLRPLRDPVMIDKILGMPRKAVAEVSRHGEPTFANSLVVQSMVMIECAFILGLTLDDLVKLKWNENVAVIDGRWRNLIIPPDVDVTLSESTVELLELYEKKYLPKLVKGDSPWLFPGRNGGHKSKNQARQQIREAIYRETRLVVTPALLRHIRALIHLRLHKDDFSTLKKILGQKFSSSTKRLYEHITTDADFKKLDDKAVSADQKARAERLQS